MLGLTYDFPTKWFFLNTITAIFQPAPDNASSKLSSCYFFQSLGVFRLSVEPEKFRNAAPDMFQILYSRSAKMDNSRLKRVYI